MGPATNRACEEGPGLFPHRTASLEHLMRGGQLVSGLGWESGAGGGVLFMKNTIITFRSLEGASRLEQIWGLGEREASGKGMSAMAAA